MGRVLIMLMLAAVLVSCSAGAGQTASDEAPISPVGGPPDPIPTVQEPKDLSGTQPCGLLTTAQLTNNGIDLPGRSKNVLDAPGCVWTNKAHTREIAIYVDMQNDVLRNVYTQRKTFPIFEVTQVAGNPAIRTMNNAAATSCVFRVAAADRQTFVVDFTSLRQGLEEPCGPARELAETVMGNLPPLKS